MASRNSPSYGFIIDNRSCIGCHACTVACKIEHQDPVGINKTWVQYLEKGVHPDVQRGFHVMRCNHCSNAPCVEICPTTSLHTRPDGIVDFDSDRCIGCKACMQACPYDAIAIQPDTGTATKCNYCTHRIDVGREPACVVVCPAESIIVGDLSDPSSKISRLLAKEKTVVRKPEKGTRPKLFYIEGDQEALDPLASKRDLRTLWGTRLPDATDAVSGLQGTPTMVRGEARRSYDIPQRHAASWGWKVSAYLFTKSVAAGAFLIPALLLILGERSALLEPAIETGLPVALIALAVTGALLVSDLKRPLRFLWVLLRPQWRSWLVRGAYLISAYGTLLAWWFLTSPDPGGQVALAGALLAVPLALASACYSGWLFGQAKGRDLWQSPLVPVHLGVQALLAGLALFLILRPTELAGALMTPMCVVLAVDGILILAEVFGRHPSEAARRAALIIRSGRRGSWFYWVCLGIGHVFAMVAALGLDSPPVAGCAALLGILVWEHLWVDAPQRIPLA